MVSVVVLTWAVVVVVGSPRTTICQIAVSVGVSVWVVAIVDVPVMVVVKPVLSIVVQNVVVPEVSVNVPVIVVVTKVLSSVEQNVVVPEIVVVLLVEVQVADVVVVTELPLKVEVAQPVDQIFQVSDS